MAYKLQREVKGGRVAGLRLGVEEVDAYLEFIRYRCRPNTWLSTGYDLQVFLNEVDKPVLDVTSKDILAFIEHQRKISPFVRNDDGKQARVSLHLAAPEAGLSPRTVRRRLATIWGLYEFLRIRGDLTRSNPVPRGMPARGRFFWSSDVLGSTRMMPLVKTPRTLPQPLEEEEVSRFLGSLYTIRDRAMFLLMLLGGLRKSEVLGLVLDDINYGQSTVMVREGKGGHQRLVPVSSVALEDTLRYINEERPSTSSKRIFLVLKGPHRGQPLTLRGLDKIIARSRIRGGTPEVQCHRLRHTCLTRLRQAGMSLEALQAQAGHQSILSTKVYLHLCAKELQEEYLKVTNEMFAPQDKGEADG